LRQWQRIVTDAPDHRTSAEVDQLSSLHPQKAFFGVPSIGPKGYKPVTRVHEETGRRQYVNKDRREAMLREYTEVNSLFRMLTDIRFKLAGLLPIASAATAGFGRQSGGGVPLVFSAFGLIVVLGVMTYHMRNDQLYNELVGRAATIERSLGLPDGVFCNRPRAWLALRVGRWRWRIDHGTGIGTVYAATAAFWLYLACDAVLRHVLAAADDITHIIALFAMACLMLGGWRAIRKQRSAASSALRRNVLSAIDLLAAHENDLSRVRGNPDFLSACAAALGGSEAVVARRAAFYSTLTPEAFGYYGLTGSTLHHSAAIASLLTDLPVHWIFDLSVNRRGGQSAGDWTSPLPKVDRNATLAAIALEKGEL
jgi:hypothetical protein